MRKFEISRASPVLLFRHSSPPLPSLSLSLFLSQLPSSEKKRNIYNNAGSHKRLIRVSSSPRSLLFTLFLRHPVGDYKGAWYKALSPLLLPFFVCLPVSSPSRRNAADRARSFRGQPRLHPRRRDAAAAAAATRDRPATYRSPVTSTRPNIASVVKMSV